MNLIDYVERIQTHRCDTWVCIKPKCGTNYTDKQAKQIEKEILEIVNSEESDLFKNYFGIKIFKHAEFKCRCGNDPKLKEHWVLTNEENL